MPIIFMSNDYYLENIPLVMFHELKNNHFCFNLYQRHRIFYECKNNVGNILVKANRPFFMFENELMSTIITLFYKAQENKQTWSGYQFWDDYEIPREGFFADLSFNIIGRNYDRRYWYAELAQEGELCHRNQ